MIAKKTSLLGMASAAVLVLSVAVAAQAEEATAIHWLEAENYESQRGSTTAKFDMSTASGGACVDNGWGGQAGHFLRYKVNLPSNFPVLHVTLRYARETAGDSAVSVTMDGDTNTTRIVKLPSTGDWGFKPEGWMYAVVQLPAVAKGAHSLELRSLADRNNVNFDGFYLSAEPLDTARAVAEAPSGPDVIAPLGEGMFPLPCKTPVALPYSRRKAFVAGSGLVQSLLSTPEPRGMGRNIAGPGLHVKLAGHGPWKNVEQTLVNSPVPTVLTRLKWAEVEVEGWLPPIFGDGGLDRGYHWSQNAGPLNGVRIAAEAARILNLPEAGALRDGYLDFQRAFDQVQTRTAQVDPDRMLPSFPGATGTQRLRPLWGVVMSVSAFNATPPNDPAVLNTLRFIQTNLHHGLHLNLGYSRGVWPYLSAEVALWHLRLGETQEAWRILRAMADRASSTVCWYEEIDHQPPGGHGDPADVWAAAETFS